MAIELSLAAVSSVPPAGQFVLDTGTADSHPYVVLVCTWCAWYRLHISNTADGQVGDPFRRADLDDVAGLRQAHVCPPAVAAAAAAALEQARRDLASDDAGHAQRPA